MSISNNTVQRRFLTISALFVAVVALTVALPLWLLITVVIDTVTIRFRFPLTRLFAFALCWAWLETIGVLAAFSLWLLGQSSNQRAHYELQRWWATNMLRALGPLCGIRVTAENVEAFSPGPTLLFVRHASLADSLVSAYVVAKLTGLRPRYVLKRELLLDPCLDVVGQRIPNYFLDRGANDSAPELHAIERLVADLGANDVGIIFPEGTRSNPAKRERSLERIRERDPQRARTPQHHAAPVAPSLERCCGDASGCSRLRRRCCVARGIRGLGHLWWDFARPATRYPPDSLRRPARVRYRHPPRRFRLRGMARPAVVDHGCCSWRRVGP